ncbi:MAG: hypothetical protein VX265_14755 [Myxococcota bacterium]|nr:hypothetical protein [Myxococcota bacterium]MEC8423436.1 hypothetical protein [Myxococcota bacterium]
MLSLLALALIGSGDAQAKERPISDHENAILVEVLPILEPRLALEYQRPISDKTSYSAGLTVGNENNLMRRLVNSALSDDAKLTVRNLGVNASYTRHFKHFNRGWFASADAAYDHYAGSLGDAGLGSYQTLEVIPSLGYKVAGMKGFTFSFDWGLGYRAVFADEQDFKVPALDGGPPAGMGPVATRGTMQMGWSF